MRACLIRVRVELHRTRNARCRSGVHLVMSRWDWSQGPPPHEPQSFGEAVREWAAVAAEKVGAGVLDVVGEVCLAVALSGATAALVWMVRQVVMPGS